jgi:arylsulfatase A-like enzyme
MGALRNAVRPNIVYIVADDLGSADLECYGGTGSPFEVAPTLNRLAREGLRCTQALANSPVCSPTRFALLTARYQYRFRGAAEEPLGTLERGSSVLGLPPETPTLPSRLRRIGYRTALVGKWHLGFPPAFGPRKSGYEYFYGATSGAIDYFTHKDSRGVHDLWENETEVFDDGYFTDLVSERAVRWIGEQSSAAPFLLSVHYTAPHWPWETRDDRTEAERISPRISHNDGGSLEKYWRMIHHMDEGIAHILGALEEKGFSANTLVVFTSDNGGERYSNNWPLMGGKMDLLEGGLRVPLLARWPGVITSGSVSATPNLTMDWSATMLHAAMAERVEGEIDGIDLRPLFADSLWNPPRKLYWRMNHRKQRAMRDGRWKYLAIGDHEYLFDVENDPRERANFAKREPERLAAMRADWEYWAESMPGIPADAKVHLVYSESDLPKPT